LKPSVTLRIGEVDSLGVYCQPVIPSAPRRKFGIQKGTQVCVYESDGELAIKPITDAYIRNMAGMAGTKGKLLNALIQDDAKEREP
jgi:bifunctional DNA-binding transcriptional regulator/antitoxin component of YhaV-PrlF toxin-antitoxin module